MSTKTERRAARETVATYHHACLAELIAHVAEAIDAHRAGTLDAHDVDERIHQYHRATQRLWSFCETGQPTQVANLITDLTTNGEPIDWWHRGAPPFHPRPTDTDTQQAHTGPLTDG